MLWLPLLHNNWYQNSRLDIGEFKEKIMSSASLMLVQGRCAHKFWLRCGINEQIVQGKLAWIKAKFFS